MGRDSGVCYGVITPKGAFELENTEELDKLFQEAIEAVETVKKNKFKKRIRRFRKAA
jgi:hypothetical protein